MGLRIGKPEDLAEIFGIKPQTVSRWLVNYKNGNKLYDYDQNGRPLKVDDDTCQCITQVVDNTVLGKRTKGESKILSMSSIREIQWLLERRQ